DTTYGHLICWSKPKKDPAPGPWGPKFYSEIRSVAGKLHVHTFRSGGLSGSSVWLARSLWCSARGEAPVHADGPKFEWMEILNAWGEGRHRGFSCGPPVGADWPDAGPCRHDRGCAGTRLSEQSPAQRPTSPGSINRRKRAAGTFGLSAQGVFDRQCGLPIYGLALDLGRYADSDRENRNPRHPAAAQRWPQRQPDALQWQPDRKQDAGRREPGVRRSRSVARARTDRAAQRRHLLHGLPPRLRDRGSAEEQRSRARADAETDPRPLQCRRSDAHRRRTIRGAARGWQDAGADRRIESHDDALELPPHHRQ